MDFKTAPVINPARGEVAIQIGNVQVGVAVTFAGLARLSHVAQAETMEGLYKRLLGFDPWTVAAAIRAFSVDGEGEEPARARADAAIAALSVADEAAWRAGIHTALTAHLEAGQKRRDEIPDLGRDIGEALDAATPGKFQAGEGPHTPA